MLRAVESERAVGRQADDAAVLKLYFGLTVFARSQARTFGQRHVDLGGIACGIVQMIDGHVALQEAESGRAVGRSIVGSCVERPA